MKTIIFTFFFAAVVPVVSHAQNTGAAVAGGAVLGHQIFRHPVRTAVVIGAGGYFLHCLPTHPGDAPRKGCIRFRKKSVISNENSNVPLSTQQKAEKIVDLDGVSAKYNAVKAANLRKLKGNLRAEAQASGMPPDPPDGCDAHHIVPDLEGRASLKQYADIARDAIKNCIDINGAENGVYLPGRKNNAQCVGSYHKTLHTENYYREISTRLQGAKNAGGCVEVRDELISIKQDLLGGNL